ncbi:MAG: sensor histidine kinase [Pyrinomonadaceae bacterium]
MELGAELISSDVIAFYELIKNAFDAGSRTGGEIRFEITLRRNDYLKLRGKVHEPGADVDRLKRDLFGLLDRSAPSVSLERFEEAFEEVDDVDEFAEILDRLYRSENRIIISDLGSGMSSRDLTDNYLVIGTPSRKHDIDAAVGRGANGKPPYLGEKGIGRLSVMRLGETLRVETAREGDAKFNILDIDWSLFNDLDAMLEDIDIKPTKGKTKPEPEWSGTRLEVGAIAADWTLDRLQKLAERDFARLTDPFRDQKRRSRIAIFWNGRRVPVGQMDHHLLEHAHATAKGSFFQDDFGRPVLECTFTAHNLGFEHPYEEDTRRFVVDDLDGLIVGTSEEVPLSALESLGPFEFEAYWYNRQRLGGIESIGEQKTVRKLQNRWSGIMLFRDGFRVLPYGEEEDDWLSMDRKALSSSGYLLNKVQFIGRVSISRLGNPDLVDQTNREGLTVCPEQEVFVGLLQFAIQSQLREFLLDIRKRYKNQPVDIREAKTQVRNLETRVKAALRHMRRVAPEERMTLDDLEQMFFDIKETFDKAQQRVDEVESENMQMVHMAGVGLLVEVVAHELARSTENALTALEALKGKEVPDQVSGLLNSLRSEMRSVSKRVRVLDPLSVSGRQRKEMFDLGELIKEILEAHELQFARHEIEPIMEIPKSSVRIKAVKGMIIQILENLISNSLYWMELRRRGDVDFQSRIKISLDSEPLTITYEDNGRGIARENRDKVFRAFFSLKEKSKRRGLGLFIARECAEYHKGSLYLDDHIDRETGRLHRFILELPDEVLA